MSITKERKQSLITDFRREASDTGSPEVQIALLTTRIGELVMRELKKLDKVAYIRFASVYKDFQDVDDFRDVLREVGKPAPRTRARAARREA